jgi:hypothetical protein
VQSPLTVRVRTRPQRDSMIDDMLGDPFLQNFFGATVPKDITVSSAPAELNVLPLPTEGRPADFSGAVGSFKIASELSAASAASGDPLTLRMHVTGSGNFDRVDSSMLDHLDSWKTYPPKSSFAAADSLGFKGEKTFEQPLIASRPGAQTLPPLAFSYFDPTTRRYETAHAAALNVNITPSLADSTLTAPPMTSAVKNAAAAPRTESKGLRPDHVVAEHVTDSLLPPYLQRGFLLTSSIVGALLAGAWLTLRRRALPRGSRRDRELKVPTQKVLNELQAAASAGDTALFFITARSAVQRRLGARWRMPPDDITPAVVQARLGGDGEDLRQLLALADESSYAGDEITNIDLARWAEIVRQHLVEVNA